MVIYLAGLQGIPEEFYEAAEVDGANWWHKFCHITIPMLSPTIIFHFSYGYNWFFSSIYSGIRYDK